MTLFLLTLVSLYAYTFWLLAVRWKFQRKCDRIQWRIHVNGIRGKSTVTRYVAAVFRASNYHTFGKTTGSAARILRPDGKDYDFGRKGYPNVNEQIEILKGFCRQRAEVVVMECMAVNPLYAQWLEEKVMRSHINIITNVRYDHPEYLGETLEEIAESLSKTIPRNGILITAETEPRLLKILAQNAKNKNARILVAARQAISPQDLAGFSHFAIEDNVAIGYEIAKLLKLPQDKALRAMQQAVADPGAFSIQLLEFELNHIAWANLFAVNDRESFVDLSHKLFKQYADYEKVVILNNRHDRPTRVKVFADLARELQFDRVVTFGDYEQVVNKAFSDDSNKSNKVVNLGNSSKFKDAAAIEILKQIVRFTKLPKILLIGTVNIHTPQAERLLHFFERLCKPRGEHSLPTPAASETHSTSHRKHSSGRQKAYVGKS